MKKKCRWRFINRPLLSALQETSLNHCLCLDYKFTCLDIFNNLRSSLLPTILFCNDAWLKLECKMDRHWVCHYLRSHNFDLKFDHFKIANLHKQIWKSQDLKRIWNLLLHPLLYCLIRDQLQCLSLHRFCKTKPLRMYWMGQQHGFLKKWLYDWAEVLGYHLICICGSWKHRVNNHQCALKMTWKYRLLE